MGKAQPGCVEGNAGKINRAVKKHWLISSAAGHDKSLEKIQQCFANGRATKEDFEKALRSHKDARDEAKSGRREAAAAFYDGI